MSERLKIPYPIIVEGKYDRLRILNICDAHVITTEGFGIFKKSEKLALLRSLAARSPLIVLTDSDGAGKLIRSHLTSMIPRERLIQLYVPRIEGKERRKEQTSAEGILGVEGMENALLRDLLSPYADPDAVLERAMENPLSKTDFYLDGLTGGTDSVARRDAFAEKLGLPAGMTPNALLAAVRMLCTYEEYCQLAGRKAEGSIEDGKKE